MRLPFPDWRVINGKSILARNAIPHQDIMIMPDGSKQGILGVRTIIPVDKEGNDKIRDAFVSLRTKDLESGRISNYDAPLDSTIDVYNKKSREGLSGRMTPAIVAGLGLAGLTAGWMYHVYKKTKAQIEKEKEDLKKLEEAKGLAASSRPPAPTRPIIEAPSLPTNVGYLGLSPAVRAKLKGLGNSPLSIETTRSTAGLARP